MKNIIQKTSKTNSMRFSDLKKTPFHIGFATPFQFSTNFHGFSPAFPHPPCSSQPYRPPPVPGLGDWSAAAGWGCESRCFRYPTRRSPSPVRIGVPPGAWKKGCVKCHGVAMCQKEISGPGGFLFGPGGIKNWKGTMWCPPVIYKLVYKPQ